MIARHWTGLAKPAHADAYVEHLHRDTFPALRAMPGFISASILRRTMPAGVEFLIVTNWQSLDSIRAFAGENVDGAVVPERVRAMMVKCDRVVRHYDVID